MEIKSSRIQPIKTGKSAGNGGEKSSDKGFSAKDMVTRTACLSGGVLGGTTVGALTGTALAGIAGVPNLSTIGAAVGAVGGASAGWMVSADGVDKKSLLLATGSLATGSVGMSVGMWGFQAFGKELAEMGCASVLGSQGALIGAAAGGILGAALPLTKCDGKPGEAMAKTVAVVAGGAGGVAMGSAIEAAIHSIAGASSGVVAESFKTLAAPLSVMMGVSGAVGGMGLSEMVDQERSIAGLGFGWIGYTLGAAVGTGMAAVGGSSLFVTASPIAGALAMGAGIVGADGDTRLDKAAARTGKVAALAWAGSAAGEAIGHGLTALTGNSLYGDVGMATGAITGGLAGFSDLNGGLKKAAKTTAGAVVGGVSGTLLGAGLTALSGQPIFQAATPILGAVAGGALGLASSYT